DWLFCAYFFFFQAEDGIRDFHVTGVQTCALPISQDILETTARLRWEVGSNIHETVVEAIYTDAARIADRAVIYPDKPPRFNLDRSEERRVGKEWRSGGATSDEKKKRT